MTDKVFVSTQEIVVKLLNHFGNSENVGNHLEENNLLDGKKSELTNIQNKVLSTFPAGETVKLQDMGNDFKSKYPDTTLSRSGHYRVIQGLSRKDLIVKPSGGGYKRIDTISPKIEDIIK